MMWRDPEVVQLVVDIIEEHVATTKYVNTVWRSSFRNLYDISIPALCLPATLLS